MVWKRTTALILVLAVISGTVLANPMFPTDGELSKVNIGNHEDEQPERQPSSNAPADNETVGPTIDDSESVTVSSSASTHLHVAPASNGTAPDTATVLDMDTVQDLNIVEQTVTESARMGGTVTAELTDEEYQRFDALRNDVEQPSESGGVYVRYDGQLYHVYVVAQF
jgi:hypothetical protein